MRITWHLGGKVNSKFVWGHYMTAVLARPDVMHESTLLTKPHSAGKETVFSRFPWWAYWKAISALMQGNRRQKCTMPRSVALPEEPISQPGSPRMKPHVCRGSSGLGLSASSHGPGQHTQARQTQKRTSQRGLANEKGSPPASSSSSPSASSLSLSSSSPSVPPDAIAAAPDPFRPPPFPPAAPGERSRGDAELARVGRS